MVCYSRAVLQKGLRAKGSHREGCLHHKHQSWATCQMLARMAYRSKSQTARAVRIPPLLCMHLSELATNFCPSVLCPVLPACQYFLTVCWCACAQVCATCVGAGDARLSVLRFQHVLVDECTQASEPEALIPLVLGAKQVRRGGRSCCYKQGGDAMRRLRSPACGLLSESVFPATRLT